MLVELRQWGRDQDAISTVYKALRRVENLETSDEGFGLPVGFEVHVHHRVALLIDSTTILVVCLDQ